MLKCKVSALHSTVTAVILHNPIFVYFLFLFLFFGPTHCVWKFTHQGSNSCHRSDLSHSSDDATKGLQNQLMFTENLLWPDINDKDGSLLLILITILLGRYYYNYHFTDRQNGTVASPQSHGWLTQDLNPTFDLITPSSKH